MLKIHQFEFNLFGENTYLLVDEVTNEAAVVDPGMMRESEQRKFDDYIAEHGITLTKIINTHLHLDHCFGDNYVKSRYGVAIYASEADAELAANIPEQARRFGMVYDAEDVTIDHHITEGDSIEIGQSQLEVLNVPGHTQGGIALYCAEGKFVLCGDSLFFHSIGRTDLPGGNHAQLVEAVNAKLMTLPTDTTVLPGHGPYTTIAEERMGNPFL
jgi:glyoxylase-like metal-dependent hydrolase (beta-lactamase superfamily II)